MINLTEELYGKLQTVTSNVYFSILPNGIDTEQTQLTFEVVESSSYNTLESNNYANSVELTVKILNKDTLELLRKGEQVKQALLNTQYAYIRDLIYKNSITIFPDYELETYQLTLIFSLYVSNDI